MKASEIQQRYVLMFLERVAQDRFPSAEDMNRIEASLTSREQLEAYLDILVEKSRPCVTRASRCSTAFSASPRCSRDSRAGAVPDAC